MKRNILLLAMAAVLSACASAPHTSSLSTARLALDSAQHGDSVHYAAEDIREASVKMDAARKASTDGEEVQAERFAQQTLVNLELAEARTHEAQMREATDEVQKSLDRLRTLNRD